MSMLKKKNQSGVVSLLVCMIIMLIITLTVLAFAKISRRAQRQALDNQLATQAIYAAESGVNDAVDKLRSGALTSDVTSCDTLEQNKISSAAQRQLNATAQISYTCVLVDSKPSEIDDIVQVDSSSIYKISAGTVDHLVISWEAVNPASPAWVAYDPFSGNFTKASDWPANAPGALRIQLVQFDDGVATRTIINSSKNDLTAVPSAVGGHALHTNLINNGEVLSGACNAANTPRACKVTLDLHTAGTHQYYLRLRSVYNASHVTIEAYDSSNNKLSFSGSQVLIDSTGRAGDILKRLKVYQPISAQSQLPSYALELADDLCKRLTVVPGSTTTDTASVSLCVPGTL